MFTQAKNIRTDDLGLAGIGLTQGRPVVRVDRFLTDKEVRTLRWKAFLRYVPSKTAEDSGYKPSRTKSRTSSSARLHDTESKQLIAIREKIALLVGCSVAQLEPLLVVRYKPGQEYKTHHDAFSTIGARTPTEQARGGQRIATVLVYLNSLDSQDTGGQTEFPLLGLSFKPTRGTAVVRRNTGEAGDIVPELVHRAVAPSKSTKYVLTCFIREKEIYTYARLKRQDDRLRRR